MCFMGPCIFFMLSTVISVVACIVWYGMVFIVLFASYYRVWHLLYCNCVTYYFVFYSVFCVVRIVFGIVRFVLCCCLFCMAYRMYCMVWHFSRVSPCIVCVLLYLLCGSYRAVFFVLYVLYYILNCTVSVSFCVPFVVYFM